MYICTLVKMLPPAYTIGVYYICKKRRKERDTMTNIFMKGDLDDMIFEGTDWQPSER